MSGIFSDRDRRLVETASADDGLGPIDSLQLYCLYRIYIVLVLRCFSNRRLAPVDLENTIAGDRRGAV
jgi:hypothetical protein